MKPFVKWAGGKRQILSKISQYFDQDFKKSRYIEPFLGGGAVFFELKPKRAILNDLNEDLINAYKVIQSDDYEKLIEKLKDLQDQYKNSEDKESLYYDIRHLDREDNWPNAYSDVERAARMIFLNRTCYNGLYRVNGKGEFNTPIGRYKNPLICDEQNITEIHEFIKKNEINIMAGSYEWAIKNAKSGDCIYIDPPYDYEDDDGFTKYQMNGFAFEDFKKLKENCDEAINKGAYVVISNNATEKVIDLFEKDSNYRIFNDINKFQTLRSINCKGEERKTGHEVIICGMNCSLPQANNIDRLIDFILAGEDVFNDKDKAKGILQVNTDRQVSYYLSALFYLGYVDRRKKFTDDVIEKINNRKEIEEDLYIKIVRKEPFKNLYKKYVESKGEIDVKEIASYLDKKQYALSSSTVNRRASTIKSWLEWIYNYSK